MARSGNYQITGNELQAMVNENLLGLKAGQSIPATNRCLTRQEVANRVHVYTGDSPEGSFIPNSSWQIGNTLYTGPSPNLTCNWNYLNATRLSDSGGNSSLIFELNQEGNPYLNADVGGYVNGSPLRLDPGSGLDWLYFGGPQYSPQMSSAVKVGNSIYVQANFGLADSGGSWNADGYGFLEVYANGTLIHDYSIFKPYTPGTSLSEHGYTFTVQANTNYYIKAYTLITYGYTLGYDSSLSSISCSEGLSNCGCYDC
jgi:hypothetical protein